MFSNWLPLLILLSVKILLAFNLRCNDDIHGSFQLMENCRACVIFIAPANLPTTSRSTTSSTTSATTTTTTTTATTITTTTTETATKPTTSLLPRNIIIGHDEPSIEQLLLFDEAKRRRRRRRDSNDTIIHQQCAQELEGPLYGYDQTHCYCNSNLCNSNIQRCIYEVTSKRHFACYHGSNSTQSPLEIRHKCRSCRISIGYNSIYHYECLTFGEREYTNQTQCTCQRPMCNQDSGTCQKLQQVPSQPRTNTILDRIFNVTVIESTSHQLSTTTTTTSTTTTTTTTTTTMTTTTTTTATTATTTTSSTSMMISTMISSTEVISSASGSSIISSSDSVIISLSNTDSTMIETANVMSTENITIINESTINNDNTTTLPELKPLKTVMIVISNHGDTLSWNLTLRLTLFQILFVSVIYSM